jgi:ABC-type antimicrobial peptide transport system permease subunit
MGKYFKIEWMAVVMILIMLGISYLIKVKNEKMRANAITKELEIFNSVTIEVNASEVESRLYADYTVKEKGELKMEQLTYIGASAKELKSKYGRNAGGLFYLDENITLLQDNGYYYEAEHAIYDKKNALFYVTSPFVAYTNGGNIIRGTNLKYDIKEEVAIAKNVDAVFFTKD